MKQRALAAQQLADANSVSSNGPRNNQPGRQTATCSLAPLAYIDVRSADKSEFAGAGAYDVLNNCTRQEVAGALPVQGSQRVPTSGQEANIFLRSTQRFRQLRHVS
jgi:hypothetical protein